MTDFPDELKETASSLVELYCNIRRETEPNYRLNPKASNIATFYKAARMCHDAGLSPEEFIQQQYDNRPNRNGPFYPSMLLNKYTRFQKVEPMAGFYDLDPAVVLKIQEGYLRDQIKRCRRTAEEVLMDDNIGLFPWFRILITDEPIPSVVEKYKRAAKESLYPALVSFLMDKKFDMTRLQ